ncbi:MAG: hypothetical protein M1823_001666 [Watsoniomyces obsoletus]|nr:MAG: hypothetical protein M1823_001666 [Watsoniomyces obsoletus]
MGMEPWQSWAVVMAIGGGAAWYYYGSRQPRKRATERPHAAGHRAEGKGRRRKEQPAKASSANDSADAISSGGEKPANHQSVKSRPGKQKKDAKGVLAKTPNENHDTSSTPRDETEADDNKEFAKRMLGVKTGTSLVTSGREGSRPRTVAPQRAEEPTKRLSVNQSSSRELSRTSSTTGGDADDDWSPARSPTLEATSTESKQVSGGDVSDMLEPPAPGPSVLRITPATQPSAPVRSSAPKTATPQETKKQRQNRRKAEEQKEARAAAEAERRVLLEKQRRTAREAEGRPAKNGLGMVSSKPVGPSPWTTSSGTATGNNQNEIATGGAVLDQQPLLDTFDRAPATASNSTNQGTGGPSTRTSVDSSGTQPSSIWDRDMPSEEDQMRMLQEMEDGAGWSTVLKGKKNNKKSKGSDGRANGNETSESETKDHPAVGNGGGDVRQQENAKPTIKATSGGGTGMDSSNSNGFTRPAHPGDSDWAVL